MRWPRQHLSEAPFITHSVPVRPVGTSSPTRLYLISLGVGTLTGSQRPGLGMPPPDSPAVSLLTRPGWGQGERTADSCRQNRADTSRLLAPEFNNARRLRGKPVRPPLRARPRPRQPELTGPQPLWGEDACPLQNPVAGVGSPACGWGAPSYSRSPSKRSWKRGPETPACTAAPWPPAQSPS